jgi:acetate kinase
MMKRRTKESATIRKTSASGAMKSGGRVLAVNGGSSSIKFALFAVEPSLLRILEGRIERIGSRDSVFAVKSEGDSENISRQVNTPDHTAAVNLLMDWIEERIAGHDLAAVGHRVVHGGPAYWKPQRITPMMLDELRQVSPFDPQHLPEEILLTEAFFRRFPNLPQVACFDTAFHHDLPRVAQLLPIPRSYETKGVRRYGFHGLSYSFLMEELERQSGKEAALGKVVLAHLGSGASLAAVYRGKPIDTSMAFTPAAGVPMSTRSGDLDPGLAWYLAQTEQMNAEQFNEMVNQRSGLLGLSETSSEMQELLGREADDSRAAEAIDVFCYSVRKWIGAFGAALGGLDTLIFSGGIGENSPSIRSRICAGLEFLGIELDQDKNAANASIIGKGHISVRVMPTDEERMIAKLVARVLQL